MRCKEIAKEYRGRAEGKIFAGLERYRKKGSENEYFGPIK